jgi:glycosyltransferase involved in cell wall biosynthesis
MNRTTVGWNGSLIHLLRLFLVETVGFAQEKQMVFETREASGKAVNRKAFPGAHSNGGGRLAFFLPSLDGGGAERIMLNLAKESAALGHSIDIVLARAEGAYLSCVPANVRVVDLGASRPLTAIPTLVRYLSLERPRALLATVTNANMAAIWASKLASGPTRCVVREASTLSVELEHSSALNRFLVPRLIRHSFVHAHAVVAPSHGVADDLARIARLPRQPIRVIYNPVVSETLLAKSREPSAHRWLHQGDIPVIVGMGRLTRQKDFATLIRAFALAQERMPSRLVILGEGEDRATLKGLCRSLGVAENVDLPGFVANPYAVLSRAALFVLSSRWEGLPGVLIEALACGARVVATDCPSGPREILDNGRYGQLCPVGDVPAMAAAMVHVLTGGYVASDPAGWIGQFDLKANTAQYLDLLVG